MDKSIEIGSEERPSIDASEVYPGKRFEEAVNDSTVESGSRLHDMHKPGNEKGLIDESLYGRIARHIAMHYDVPESPTAFICWRLFCEECIEQGLSLCSYPTYSRLVSLQKVNSQISRRGVRRASRRHHPWYLTLGRSIPWEPERPRELSHIDHTEIDVEVGCASSESTPISGARKRVMRAEHAEAERRAELVERFLRDGCRPIHVPERTFRRWVAAYESARTAYVTGAVGLLPQK